MGTTPVHDHNHPPLIGMHFFFATVPPPKGLIFERRRSFEKIKEESV
jgi:hypothetical protein